MPLSIPGRFNRAIQKFLSVKGGALITDVGADILTVFSLFFGVENRYLEGWDRFAGLFSASAAASNQSAIRFRNPSGSNVMTVVEKILITSPSAGNVAAYLGAINTDLASVGTQAGRVDARTVRSSSLIPSTQNTTPSAPTFGAQIFQTSLSAGGNYDAILTDDQELTLLPGDSLEFVELTVNQTLTVSILFRERPLETSELT
jgi:hypothetical protein